MAINEEEFSRLVARVDRMSENVVNAQAATTQAIFEMKAEMVKELHQLRIEMLEAHNSAKEKESSAGLTKQSYALLGSFIAVIMALVEVVKGLVLPIP